MLTNRRLRWLLTGAATTMAASAALVATTAVTAALAAQPLTSSEFNQARQALLLISTGSAATARRNDARVSGTWPANIQTGRAFATDRATANIAMREPSASAGDTRHVVCAEAHGTFSTAGLPAPQGSPARTYRYAVVCFDPATGTITDTGYDNSPVDEALVTTETLDTTSPIK